METKKNRSNVSYHEAFFKTSHNSYKYSIREQLNKGVRGLEYDIHDDRIQLLNDFEVYHLSRIQNGESNDEENPSDFLLSNWLKILQDWSNKQGKEHAPITLFIELKCSLVDSNNKPDNLYGIEKLNQIITDSISLSKLYTYRMQFSKDLLWHIKKNGIELLKYKTLKIQPFKSINELSNDLSNFIELIEEIELRDSIKDFLSKNGRFYESPAAKIKHHAYKGGLLEHTLQTVKLSISILENIKDELNIDKDLVIAGATLHDVGKINCYDITDESIEITNIYLKQDHIINGIKLISQNIKSENIDELIHIVASHHNIKEWGSPIEPKSREAWIVHFAENLSSKILG